MKNQGMEITSAAIGLIVFVISAALILWFVLDIGQDTVNIGTIDQIKTWVAAQSKVYQLETEKEYVAKKALGLSARPPVAELQEPLEIREKIQLEMQNNAPPEAVQEIGESMVDCWNAFGKGELPFKVDNKEVFCYSCRAIWIDQKLREEQLGSFKASLTNEPIDPFQETTYAEYLSNINPEYSLLLPESISLKNDLFIYFVVIYGEKKAKEMADFFQAKIETSQESTEGLGTMGSLMALSAGLFFGAGNLQTGVAAVNIASYLAQEKPYYPFIIIGDAQLMDTLCNEKPFMEENTV